MKLVESFYENEKNKENMVFPAFRNNFCNCQSIVNEDDVTKNAFFLYFIGKYPSKNYQW